MKGNILTLFLFFLCSSISLAQYPIINHIDWMQGQLNPAFLGINKQENVLLDYNRSWRSNEVNSNLGIIQYDRALLNSNNQNLGGVGVSILNNQVNYKDVYNRFQASLGAAYGFQIKKEILLNLGLQGAFYDDHVNNLGLTTGSQYVPGWGFDSGIGSNEPMTNLRANYFGISTGVFLYQSSEDPLPDNYFGFSVKNLNRPVNSFYEDSSRLAPQFNLMGGMKILEGLRNKLLGEVWYTNSNHKGNLTFGVVYQADNLISAQSSEGNVSLRLVSRYSIHNKFLLGGQLLYDQFVLGFTYDIPVPNVNERSYDSGFEILLGFRRKVKAPQLRQKKKKAKNQPKASVPSMEKIIIERDSTTIIYRSEPAIEKDSKVDSSNKSGNANVGTLINDAPLQSKVYFDFASRNISAESETFLREFISAFYLQGKSVITVTGHTDNVGSNEFNLKLSLDRAESVREKLISFGIRSDQIIVKGKGEEAPLVPNNTAENRAINRRVEIDFY